MKLIINVFLLSLPIALHAGSSFSKQSQQQPNAVKIMVEILKKTDPNNNLNNDQLETLAYAYDTYNWDTMIGITQKQSSNDLKYSIPVFCCYFCNVGGVKTYGIDFEAVYNPHPRPELKKIEEDLDTLLENDPDEASERLSRIQSSVDAFNAPIAKDNRQFSINEFQTYPTSNPTIIVKAGVYTIQDKQ